MDNNFCLQQVKNPNKLTHQKIQSEFQDVYNERKKDTTGPFIAKYGVGLFSNGDEQISFKNL